ncbi:MAG: peptidoglycan editing factor PgeF [Pseudomonadota bacterium]
MIEAECLKSGSGGIRIRHGFFTREAGHSTGLYASLNTGLGSDDDRETVMKNRETVANALGLTGERLVTPYQIHSPDAVIVDEPWPPQHGPKADAAVTAKPGIAVAVNTADCTPVLFADPAAGVVAAAHAGWKGAFGGVLKWTVEAMVEAGASRQNISAAIGPTISQAAYEVGPEFKERFVEADNGYARFFIPSEREGHHMFDLPAFVEMRLEEAGIGHIENLHLCTYADEDRFFSYRRKTHRSEADYGRQLSAIAIEV